jgi:endothelin-converting enzyme/putative endopeptidase
MRNQLVAFMFVSLPLAIAIGQTQSRTAVELESLDRRADPCSDFYQFACGGWIEKNPLPPDRLSYGRIQEIQDRNFAILRRILETPGATGDARRASDYYAACVDTAAIEARGLRPLQPVFARIDALRRREDLPRLLGYLHRIAAEPPALGAPSAASAYPFFSFVARSDPRDARLQIAWVRPDGLALPDRDAYLKSDERSIALRRDYHAHVERMLTLAGDPASRATAGADAVLSIETALAGAMLDATARRDPNALNHVMTLAELQASAPAFDFARYVTATGAPKFARLNVAQPEHIRLVSRLVAGTPLEDIKSYLRWHLLHGAAAVLPKAFVDADFEFFSRKLLGQPQEQPRWRRCVTRTDEQLGEALGQAFVAETFGPQAKQDMLAMVRGIKAALARDMNGLPWMGDATKKAALDKLSGVEDRIGYPDKWRDYSALHLTSGDAFGNLLQTREWANARDRARIDQPTDRTEWAMTPPSVNSYYSSDRNSINFPAGILQPPFYLVGRDAALNYGSAGGLIGHELTHGFDDQGRKFDAQGNLRDWWTAEDAKAFETRAACFVDQYSTYPVAGDTHVNGRLTLGENTGDNGGLRLALMAYLAGPGLTAQPVDGFTPEQRVFLGWSQAWCENARPEAERMKAATNPHASNRYRVNGPLSNMPEFQRAFSCKADAPMVRQNACRVW